jgi:hypothetical protein
MQAPVSLKRQNGQLIITIRADGKGIAKGVADFQSLSIGVGIGGLRQRTKELDGVLRRENIHPGTLVEVAIPSPQRDDHWADRRKSAGRFAGLLDGTLHNPALEGTQVFHDDKHCHVAQARACSQRPSDLSESPLLADEVALLVAIGNHGLIWPENCAAQIEISECAL